MANSSVLKEFLIALGFKVDEPGLKKFEKGVNDAEKASKRFALAVTATATAVTTAVVKIAGDFEDLYYASERLHSSARNIRATELSLQNMGTTAEGARGSLEGLAAFVRNNPGGESFINRLGVDTRDATGAARDYTDVIADLGKRFAAMPYPIARLRAQLVGIDDITLQALIRGTDEFTRKAKARADSFGLDFKKASEEGLNFKRAMRDLGDTVYLSLVRLVVPVLRVITPLIEKGVAAVEAMNRATHGWAGSLLALVAVFAPVAFFAWRLFKVVGGLLETLGLAGPVLEGFGAALAEAFLPITLIIAAIASLWLLWDDFQTYLKGGNALLDWGPALEAVASLKEGLKDIGDAAREVGAAFKDVFGPDFANWLSELGLDLGKLVGWLAEFGKDAIIGAVYGVATLLKEIAVVMSIIAHLIRGDFSGAWDVFAKAARGALDDVKDFIAGLAKDISDLWYRMTHKGAAPPVASADTAPADNRPASSMAERRAQGQARLRAGGDPGAASYSAGRVANDNHVAIARAGRAGLSVVQQAMDFFTAQGWTRQQAAGLVANLLSESKLDPNAVGDHGGAIGIGQWHKDRQEAFEKWAGHSIKGSTLAEQLAFVQYELTQGARRAAGRALGAQTTAEGAGDVVSRQYEAPKDAEGEAAKRAALARDLYTVQPMPAARLSAGPAATAAAAGAVNVNQTTTIKVEGASDPQRTAERVATAQGATNSDLVRNMRSAIN